MHRSEHQPSRQCRRFFVGPPWSVHRTAQFRDDAPQRPSGTLEARGRGRVQGTLDQRGTWETARAGRPLKRGAKQPPFKGVRPNVIVADGCWIDRAAHDEGDATHPARATVFPEQCGEGSAGDPFDDAPQAALDARCVGRPGAHDGVIGLAGRRNRRVGKRDRPPVNHAGRTGRARDEHDRRPAGLDAAAEDGSL